MKDVLVGKEQVAARRSGCDEGGGREGADGAKLATGLPGASITVDVKGKSVPVIILIDRDRNDANPRVNPWQTDINEGNKQIAHGITRVPRPINL